MLSRAPQSAAVAEHVGSQKCGILYLVAPRNVLRSRLRPPQAVGGLRAVGLRVGGLRATACGGAACGGCARGGAAHGTVRGRLRAPAPCLPPGLLPCPASHACTHHLRMLCWVKGEGFQAGGSGLLRGAKKVGRCGGPGRSRGFGGGSAAQRQKTKKEKGGEEGGKGGGGTKTGVGDRRPPDVRLHLGCREED